MAKLKETKIRLNKLLAQSNVASRRQADRLIQDGKVKVNGKIVSELGTKVDKEKDKIIVKGRTVLMEQEKVYYMFHKPKKVLSTTKDTENRPVVMDYFKKTKKRIFPVGRLDWDTEGMLLLTNDGDFSKKIMDPKSKIIKTYMAKLSGSPKPYQIEKLKKGVKSRGHILKAVDVQLIRSKQPTKYQWVKIQITEGKNRQIHKMFEALRLDVKKLQRVSIGKLKLASLHRGKI